MVNTLDQALQPLSVAAFIFGFGILRYPSDTPRVCLSILYMLIMWSVYVYVFYYVTSFFSSRIFHGILDIFIVIINIFVTIISISVFYHKYQKFRTCIRKLSFVDNTLELIGTPKEYFKIRKSTKWIFIKWSTMVCTIWFIDSLWFIDKHNDIRAMFIPIVKDYLQHINNLIDIIYMFLLSFIGTRLDRINNYIEELSEIEDYGIRCTWKKPLVVTGPCIRGAENRKRILWTIMHLHSELCRTTFEIHGFFEIHMTMQMMSYFIVLVAIMYFEYHTMLCVKKMYSGDSIRLKLLFCSHAWLLICLTKCLSFNYVCENVSAKAKKTKDIIHKLTNLICFTEIREEFILQISLRPLKFSAFGLFYFGNGFIRQFFVSSAAAVVFMLQTDSTTIPRIVFTNTNMTC